MCFGGNGQDGKARECRIQHGDGGLGFQNSLPGPKHIPPDSKAPNGPSSREINATAHPGFLHTSNIQRRGRAASDRVHL